MESEFSPVFFDEKKTESEFSPAFFDDAQAQWRKNKIKVMNSARRWSGAFRYGCEHRSRTRTKQRCNRKLTDYEALCNFHYQTIFISWSN